jgi:hypothetical protein
MTTDQVSSNGYLGSGLDLDLEAGALKRLHGDLHLVDATTTQHLAAPPPPLASSSRGWRRRTGGRIFFLWFFSFLLVWLFYFGPERKALLSAKPSWSYEFTCLVLFLEGVQIGRGFDVGDVVDCDGSKRLVHVKQYL